MPEYLTDGDRFAFMRDKVNATSGLVLNVGCHVDGAGLRAAHPDRVLNCDVAVQAGFDYHVDRLFDARGPWPFADGEAELVVLGDILEHLYDIEILAALFEARRVAASVCITVPHDVYLEDALDPEATYKAHCNTIDEAKIRKLVEWAGFDIVELHVVRNVGSPKPSDMFLVLAT